MGKTKSIPVRMDDVLLGRIDKAVNGGNRSAFILEAIASRLDGIENPAPVIEFTPKEQIKVLDGAKRIDQMMDEAIEQAMMLRTDFLTGLNNADLAKLIASRLPKVDTGDKSLEGDVLSLTECINGLVSIEDVTKELNRVKGELNKTTHEKNIAQKVLAAKGVEGWREAAQSIYAGACEYVLNLVIRGNLPGYGDGGGLSQRGYEEIGKEVEKGLKTWRII